MGRLVAILVALLSFSAYAVNFNLTFKNCVEGEDIYVKTLHIYNGEVAELSHQEGDTIEFGDSFTIKTSIKDRKDLFPSEYREELEKEGKTDIIVIGNEERDFIIQPTSSSPKAEVFIFQKGKGFIPKMIKWGGMEGFFNYRMELELFRR